MTSPTPDREALAAERLSLELPRLTILNGPVADDVRTLLDALARSSGGGEAGPWKLFDPEPNNHHSALYLQFPGGFLADISHNDREGHDIALGQWIVDTLNAAKGMS